MELADELADGAKGAALPLIRHDLGLSYGQADLLASVPMLVGGLLELPLGLLAAEGRRRHRTVLAGGVVFILALAAAAVARTLPELMAAFVAFFPASGAFVSLTQAELMDAAPDRRAQHMARWDLAGSAGAVVGPLLLAAVLAAGEAGAMAIWSWPRSVPPPGSAFAGAARSRRPGPSAQATPPGQVRLAGQARPTV